MVFYPYFIPAGEYSEFTAESYALHYCENSWLDKNLYQRLRNTLSKNNILRKLFYKRPDKINEIIRNIIKNNEGKKTAHNRTVYASPQ
jgi:uncharacterized protein VirK/YbjX